MKHNPSNLRQGRAGFTLVEVMVSMTIAVLVMGLALSTFIFGLRTMYKDGQRLATNASLRYFIAQVSKETIDASEFYIFPTYLSLDGSVNLTTDVTNVITTLDDIDLYHGDCLVLVTRVGLNAGDAIRQFRVYYRVVTDSNNEGPIRYYEGTDYGDASTQTSLTTLLNAVNIRTTPAYPGSRVLALRCRGRPRNNSTTQFYPIFSSEFPTITKTNENVSINAEIINGTSINSLLSSSSFNYTISPRR